MNNPLAIIFRRRAEIEREMQECRDHLQRLQSELPELDVAERVLTRLGAEEKSGEPATATEARAIIESTLDKPPGIPTMPEMVIEALSSPEAGWHDGMEPRDIMKFIANKWWPDVRAELVGPIAWRMWKRGQLEKTGTFYRMPQKNEPTDTPPKDASAGSDRRRII